MNDEDAAVFNIEIALEVFANVENQTKNFVKFRLRKRLIEEYRKTKKPLIEMTVRQLKLIVDEEIFLSKK